MKLYIGTSGWQHKEMKGVFYPPELSSNDWLNYYMDHFSTVEVNTSFYRMKLKKVYLKWKKAAPKNFIFAAKLYRFLTHIKRLIIDEESTAVLTADLKNFSALGEKLGPILIQLPPSSKLNLERLEAFFKALAIASKKIFKIPPLFAIEFRHASWLNADTYALLKKHRIAFCISDSPAWPTEKVKTADWVYARFHGRPRLFASPYSKKVLEKWAKELKKLRPKKLFIYFNNSSGQPTVNAQTMIRVFKKN